jgi:hypothetical protein
MSNDKVAATFHGSPVRTAKRLADSLVALASAREAAGWQRVATVEEIHEVSTVLEQAACSDAVDRAETRADALREAAEAQRQLAQQAKTLNGVAEHTDFADWLDERANAIDPRRLEGAHP